jgi:hypothetical protein
MTVTTEEARMPTTLCTFNANNLFVRYRFGQTFPGDMSGKSAVNEPSLGYLPMYDPDMFDLFNPLQRDLTAKALKRGATGLPEVLCLQEIESLIALRAFNERHLGATTSGRCWSIRGTFARSTWAC